MKTGITVVDMVDAAMGLIATEPIAHVAKAPTSAQDIVTLSAGVLSASVDIAPEPPAPVTLPLDTCPAPTVIAVSSVQTTSTHQSWSATVVTATVASAAPTLVACAELNASVGDVWWTPQRETALAADDIAPVRVTAIVLEPKVGAIKPHSSILAAPLIEDLVPISVKATLL